jgi:hypothetical protein
MGFKKAYLVGFSFHDKSLKYHWYEDHNIEVFDSPPYRNVVEKLESTPTHNLFFNNARRRINLIGLTIFQPTISYLDYKIITYEMGKRSLPLEPCDMTSFREVLIYRAVEANNFEFASKIIENC